MSILRSASKKGRDKRKLAPVGFLVCGGTLSYLEQLCLSSCVACGHKVTLYHYHEVKLVPEDVKLADARKVLDPGTEIKWSKGETEVLLERFRYALLKAEPGIIWSDTDAYCTQPMQPRDGYLFGWELRDYIGVGVLALPEESEALDLAHRHAFGEDMETPLEGRGPLAMTDALRRTGEIEHAYDQHALYPFAAHEVDLILRRKHDSSQNILSGTMSVHLYGDAIKRRLIASGKTEPKRWSLLGRLLRRSKLDPEQAPFAVTLRNKAGDPVAMTMTVRHPGESLHAANMLAETGDSAIATQRADERPRTSPGNIEAPRPQDSDALGRVLVVTCMKNEGPYILEWIGYHLSIGVSHFLVYTNDCDDGTVEMLDHLQTRGIVTRIDNPFKPGQRPQWIALGDAQKHDEFNRCDRFISMDLDEFINVHTGDGSLAALVDATGDPDMISMTWRFFGCGGQIAFEDKPVTEQFLHAAPENCSKPIQNWGFKTLVRQPMAFERLGVHRPQDLLSGAKDPSWVNGSGHPMPSIYIDNGWRSSRMSWGYGLATLNHYAVRSIEAFLVKRDRGRVNHIKRDQGLEYWQVFNRNDEPANSILPAARRAASMIRFLKSDPVLAELHQRSVAWHRDKISELLARPDFKELYTHLIAKPMEHDLGIDRGINEAHTAAELSR